MLAVKCETSCVMNLNTLNNIYDMHYRFETLANCDIFNDVNLPTMTSVGLH